MATFSSKSFFFTPESNLFTVDMSTLDNGGTRPVFHQVYNDSIDEGFTMVSSSTGQNVDYVIDRTDYNNDNEILGWNLIPTDESIRKVPRCKGTRVLIVNT
jgi:hypothetical protein